MKRKWRSLSIAHVLAVTVLVPVAMNPPTAAAYWNGTIMAGRVLRDWGPNVETSACRVAAYARIDGNLSLLLPNHCKERVGPDEQPYAPAYTNGDVQIGWWGVPNSSWQDRDLTYITLDVNSDWYPTSGRNRIYRGENGSFDIYWYMTTAPTSAGDGCPSFPRGGSYPDTVRRMWQQTMMTTSWYNTRLATGLTNEGDGCVVFTDFGQHTNCCDSGTPVISDDLTTLSGMITAYNSNYDGNVDEGTKTNTGNNGNPALYFIPTYAGLQDLDAYFDTHSTMTGAKLCITSSC